MTFETTETGPVLALMTYMDEHLYDVDWPSAGTPNDWSDNWWNTWLAAGCRAVLDRRSDIESGSVSAGEVWCGAANRAEPFSYTRRDEEFLHHWFVEHRTSIDRAIERSATAAPASATRPAYAEGRSRQHVLLPNGLVGLVLTHSSLNSAGEVPVYVRDATSSWSSDLFPVESLVFAVPGDIIVGQNGSRAPYAGVTGGDNNLQVTVEGMTVAWDMAGLKHEHVFAPPPPGREDLVITHNGVEYVRKDVIDDDLRKQTEILHRGSVEHSLCGVYDQVTRRADRATEYLKFGPRYRDYTVTVDQNVRVRRTFTVTGATDEETARQRAIASVTDVRPRVEGALPNEAISVRTVGDHLIYGNPRLVGG